ncbi:MAG: hypothetical protein AAF249_05065 [Pseudomonadota bacterium]
MNLGGRAALSVPLIALIVASAYALLVAMFESGNGILDGWAVLQLNFVYALLIMLPVGVLCALPILILGAYLPKRRGLWLAAIGAFLSISIGVVFFGHDDPSAWIPITFVFGAVGAACAALWWLFVERFRYSDEGEGQ